MEASLDCLMAEKKEEDKKYEHLKKYEKKAREAENIITNLDLTHMEVYSRAAKDVLKVEKDNIQDIRQTDLSKLKESKHQIALADKMADLYKEKAVEYFSKARGKAGEKWDLDEFDESLLVKAVYGTTRAQLRNIIASEKDQFSPDRFIAGYRKKFMESISNDLKAVAGQHLKEEHIDDIVKYTRLDKHDVDSSRLSLPEAIDYLDLYIEQGSITPKQVKDKHKKPEKKKKGK
jgi:hypothetical protein